MMMKGAEKARSGMLAANDRALAEQERETRPTRRQRFEGTRQKTGESEADHNRSVKVEILEASKLIIASFAQSGPVPFHDSHCARALTND